VFSRSAAAPDALQISGDRALGDLEADLQKFAVDLRCSPVRILSRHAADESPNLLTRASENPFTPDSTEQSLIGIAYNFIK
jgi:hypothetical protein